MSTPSPSATNAPRRGLTRLSGAGTAAMAALLVAAAFPAAASPAAGLGSAAGAPGAALPAAATPGSAAAPAQGQRAVCPRGRGVTVVVDFGATHKASCAPGDPRTGLAALTSAGFRVAYVQRVPGFVCRIDGRPTASQDACVVTPPTSKYWSYWHAKRGGRWTYGASAAGTFNPAPGTVEGWSFGAGKPPTMAPPK